MEDEKTVDMVVKKPKQSKIVWTAALAASAATLAVVATLLENQGWALAGGILSAINAGLAMYLRLAMPDIDAPIGERPSR